MHVQSRGDLGFTVFAQPDTQTRDDGTGYLTQGDSSAATGSLRVGNKTPN